MKHTNHLFWSDSNGKKMVVSKVSKREGDEKYRREREGKISKKERNRKKKNFNIWSLLDFVFE